MNKAKTVLHKNIFYTQRRKNGITVEVSMQWNDSYGENVFSALPTTFRSVMAVPT